MNGTQVSDQLDRAATEGIESEDDPWSRPTGLLVAMAVFAVWSALVIPAMRWQLNTDGVSYLSVAHKYLAGDFASAVNGYWSPLYCWLLAMLIGVGVEPLLAPKILAALTGEGILVATWWLAANLGVPRDGRLLICLTSAPILLYFGMSLVTPDLLMTGVVLLYLAHVTSPAEQHGTSWQHRFASGVVGGVAYLAKAYALSFVAVHLTLVNLLDLARARAARPRVALAAVAGYLGLVLVVAPWVACLSAKYGYLTTGSVGRFSLAFNRPGFRLPIHWQGFLPPPDPLAVSAWDDATFFRFEAWDPLATAGDRAAFVGNVRRNVRHLVAIGGGFTVLLWPILIGAIAAAWRERVPGRRRTAMVVLAAVFVFPLAYLLLHLFDRFLSLPCVLLLVLGAWVAAAAVRPLRGGPWVRRVATIVVCASFLFAPVGNTGPGGDGDGDASASAWLRSAFARWSLPSEPPGQRYLATLAAGMRDVVPTDARVASGNLWDQSLLLSYLIGAHYWGMSAPDASPERIRADLQANGIEYFWMWGMPKKYPVVVGWPRVRVPGFEGFPLYRVPPSVPGRKEDGEAR